MNYKIKDLPFDERPREKLKSKGKEALSNEELIAILLKTGSKEKSAKDIAIELIKSLKDIRDLHTISIADLTRIKGIKEAKAITLIAAIELGKRASQIFYEEKVKIQHAEDVFFLLRPQMIGLKQEQLIALFLNTKNELLSYKVIFVGTQNKSITHPREIFYYAIKSGAMKIILAHNHPSNDVTPSQEDMEFTKKIVESGLLLQIPVIDHIVLGETQFFSFFDHHLL